MEKTKIQVYGAMWCGDCRRAKHLLDERQVSYDWHDIEGNPEATAYVQQVNGGKRIIPTIVFEDGSVLVEPSNAELDKKLAELSL